MTDENVDSKGTVPVNEQMTEQKPYQRPRKVKDKGGQFATPEVLDFITKNGFVWNNGRKCYQKRQGRKVTKLNFYSDKKVTIKYDDPKMDKGVWGKKTTSDNLNTDDISQLIKELEDKINLNSQLKEVEKDTATADPIKAPKVEVPKVEAPKPVVEPMVEAKVETPKVEEPKVEMPLLEKAQNFVKELIEGKKDEEPKVVEEPKVELKVEEPTGVEISVAPLEQMPTDIVALSAPANAKGGDDEPVMSKEDEDMIRDAAEELGLDPSNVTKEILDETKEMMRMDEKPCDCVKEEQPSDVVEKAAPEVPETPEDEIIEEPVKEEPSDAIKVEAPPASIIPEKGAESFASPDGAVEKLASDMGAAVKTVEKTAEKIVKEDIVEPAEEMVEGSVAIVKGPIQAIKARDWDDFAVWALGIGLIASPFLYAWYRTTKKTQKTQ